jgi:hypothetical protein
MAVDKFRNVNYKKCMLFNQLFIKGTSISVDEAAPPTGAVSMGSRLAAIFSPGGGREGTGTY